MFLQHRHKSRHLLSAACSVLLVVSSACQPQSKPTAVSPTESQGETKPVSKEVTFTRDVAPIVFEKCSRCHHPGESAPFSLLSYDDVRRRAKQIAEVTQKRIMPPWLPEKQNHEFISDRCLSDRELKTLEQWSSAGAPRGEDDDLPAAPTFTTGWQTGTPDLVLESPTYDLSANDSDVFRNFIVPIQLDQPRWVQSIEVRPENPRVTHHARLGVDSSNESIRRDAEDPKPGYAGMAWGQDPDGQLVIWAPGMNADPGTPGIAWRLQPKTCLVLHTHMQPSGKPEEVKFRIGIRFTDEPPKQHPAMLRIGSRDIDIPAGEPHHVVTDEYVLPIDVDLHRIFPHAHSLCRELKVVAEFPDGSRDTLISIPHFDENWHETYQYRKPIRLPRGTRLTTTFAYDNSEANPRNRHRPPVRVAYGSNADDEMADVYLQVTAAQADRRAVLMEHCRNYELQSQIVGFKHALELHPDDPWSQEALATCYVGVGKPIEAIGLLEQRLKTGSPAVFPVVSLGMAQLGSGDLGGAESKFRRAISMDDQYPLAWLGLGKALLAQKKSETAEEAHRRALELAPGLLEARLNLADLLIKRGQLDEAERLCSANLSDSPDMANLYLKLAEISVKRHRNEEALQHFITAQQLAPYTHPPKVLLAVYCFQNGDPAAARKLLSEARAESPDHPVPTLYFGQMARRQREFESARIYLATCATQPIPENWPDSHKRRFLSLLHSERYQLAQQLKDDELARNALMQWFECDPENPLLQKIYGKSRPAPMP